MPKMGNNAAQIAEDGLYSCEDGVFVVLFSKPLNCWTYFAND